MILSKVGDIKETLCEMMTLSTNSSIPMSLTQYMCGVPRYKYAVELKGTI